VARALSAGLAWGALERATLPCRSGRGGRHAKVALRQPEIRHGSRNARFGPSTSRRWSAPDARLPNMEELGLDHAGVRLGDDGRVTVDQQQRTSAAGIYAAGDVTGPPWLTKPGGGAGPWPAATRSGGTGQVRGERLPRSVNTRPPRAAVGLTAEQATAAGRPAPAARAQPDPRRGGLGIGQPRHALG
jgi:Pyridine nucleotide-disulphide oxidoreductase